MSLSDVLEANADQLTSLWRERLGATVSPAAKDLRPLVDELVRSLRTPDQPWPSFDSAAALGRARLDDGAPIGALTREIALVGEGALELASGGDQPPADAELRRLISALGEMSAAAVEAYTEQQQEQIVAEAARRYSSFAHEVRNTINAGRLTAKLLSRGQQEKQETYLDRLQRAFFELSQMVKQGYQLFPRPDERSSRPQQGSSEPS